MLKHKQSIGLWLVGAGIVLGGCRAGPERAEDAKEGPDPTAAVVVEPGAEFVAEPELAERLDVIALYQHTGGSRFIVSFVPWKNDDAGVLDERLNRYAADANERFLSVVAGKRVVSLESLPDDPFASAGLPSRLFAYLNGPEASAICDAAALMGATAGGVWTVSWNGTVGELDEVERALDAFFRGFHITVHNEPALRD